MEISVQAIVVGLGALATLAVTGIGLRNKYHREQIEDLRQRNGILESEKKNWVEERKDLLAEIARLERQNTNFLQQLVRFQSGMDKKDETEEKA